jgi:hypothetical protein
MFGTETNVWDRIAFGTENGCSDVTIVGENPAVTTTLETVRWESDVYAFLYADALQSVASSNAADAAGGTGARTVRVTGVNSAGTVISEVVTLNGQTAVAMTAGNALLVVTGIEVVTFGSGGVNAGDIYVGTGTFASGVPAVKNGRIPPGYGVEVDGVYMVPAGKTLVIKDIFFSAASATAGSQRWIIEGQRSLTQVSPYVIYTGNSAAAAPHVRTLSKPLVIPALTKFQIKALSSAGTGPAYARLEGTLVDNAVQSFIRG